MDLTPFVRALRDALLQREAERQARHRLDDVARPCWHCGTLTRWVDINFDTPLCPGQCTDRNFEAFWSAVARDHRKGRDHP